MAIAFRAESHVVATGTSPTLAEPTGTVQNDLLIAVALCANAQTISAPAGWTVLYSGTGGTSFKYNIAYIVRGTSAPSMTWAMSGSAFREVYVQCFSGVDTTSPIDANAETPSVGGTLPDPPSVTAVDTAALCLAFGSNWGGVNSWTPPAGYTMVSFNAAATDSAVASKQLSASGAENPGTFTGAGIASSQLYAASVTLKPAAGGGTTNALAGTCAATSTLTAALSVSARLAGTAVAQSTVTAALTVPVPVGGAVAATAAVTGSLSTAAPLAGTAAASSTVSGSLSVAAPLRGATAAQAALTGVLTNTAPGSVALVGTVPAASTVAGALTTAAPVVGQITATSTVTGSLTVTAAGTVALQGTVAATATLSGTLLVTKPLAGVTAAASTVSGSLTVGAGLRTTVAGQATAAGALTIRHQLAGSLAGTSTVAGAVVVSRPLAALITAASTLAGTLTNQGPVTSVGRLEAGTTATFSEGRGTAVVSESTSGVTALIE